MDTLAIIKDLINQNGITQKKLTDYLGISKNAFTNWSNGSNSSYIKHLPRIAEFFNVSVDYLLGREQKQDDGNSELLLSANESPTKKQILNLTEKILNTVSNEEELDALRILLEKFAK